VCGSMQSEAQGTRHFRTLLFTVRVRRGCAPAPTRTHCMVQYTLDGVFRLRRPKTVCAADQNSRGPGAPAVQGFRNFWVPGGSVVRNGCVCACVRDAPRAARAALNAAMLC
jgi:hypothetical protein